MKMTDELQESFKKAGFIIIPTDSKGRSEEFRAHRLRDHATISLIYGRKSKNITRGQYSAPFVEKLTINWQNSANLRDLLTTIRCACTDCIAEIKSWKSR